MENLIIINKRVYLRLLIAGTLMALIGMYLQYGNPPEFFNPAFSKFFFTSSVIMIIPGIIFLWIRPMEEIKEENEKLSLYILRTRNAFIFSAIMIMTSILTYSTSTDMSYFFLFLGAVAFLVALVLHAIALGIYKKASS